MTNPTRSTRSITLNLRSIIETVELALTWKEMLPVVLPTFERTLRGQWAKAFAAPLPEWKLGTRLVAHLEGLALAARSYGLALGWDVTTDMPLPFEGPAPAPVSTLAVAPTPEDNTVACDECDATGEVTDEVDCLNPLRGEHFTRAVRSTCRHCDGLGHVTAPEVDEEAEALAGAPVWTMDDTNVAVFAVVEGGL